MKNIEYESLKAGDKFIRYSKYGYIFGFVDYISYITNAKKECNYKEWYIKSTNGVTYLYNECHKVDQINDPKKVEIFIKRLKQTYETKRI